MKSNIKKSVIFYIFILSLFCLISCEFFEPPVDHGEKKSAAVENEIVNKDLTIKINSPEYKYYETSPALIYENTGKITEIILNDTKITKENSDILSESITGFNKLTIIGENESGEMTTGTVEYFVNDLSTGASGIFFDDFNRCDAIDDIGNFWLKYPVKASDYYDRDFFMIEDNRLLGVGCDQIGAQRKELGVTQCHHAIIDQEIIQAVDILSLNDEPDIWVNIQLSLMSDIFDQISAGLKKNGDEYQLLLIDSLNSDGIPTFDIVESQNLPASIKDLNKITLIFHRKGNIYSALLIDSNNYILGKISNKEYSDNTYVFYSSGIVINYPNNISTEDEVLAVLDNYRYYKK